MKSEVNQIFAETLYTYFPDKKSLIQFLTDNLDLSKESIQRRLRNDIPFTFEEICCIVSLLDISVDRLIGLNKTGSAFFDLYMHKSEDPVKIYAETLQINATLLEITKGAKPVNINVILNRLPYGFTLPYENLSKFHYYKWYYHTQVLSTNFKYSDFTIEKDITDAYQKYMDVSNNLEANVTMLMDDNIFLSMVREIDYFVKRGLIKNNEHAALRHELLEIVDLMKGIAKNGNSGTPTEMLMYISAVDLEPCYSHIQYGNKEFIQFWSPTAEAIVSYNPAICSWQKKWIESLKRYATLITKCNEKEAIKYFDNQRKYINNYFR